MLEIRDHRFESTKNLNSLSPSSIYTISSQSSKMAPAGTLWTTPYQAKGKIVRSLSILIIYNTQEFFSLRTRSKPLLLLQASRSLSLLLMSTWWTTRSLNSCPSSPTARSLLGKALTASSSSRVPLLPVTVSTLSYRSQVSSAT